MFKELNEGLGVIMWTYLHKCEMVHAYCWNTRWLDQALEHLLPVLGAEPGNTNWHQ